ncbi:MAG: M56 family metallopeptidase [Prolixibacteraceae bacterium]|nr:M56 family metallopeptidase [Prolixibacteraceae bacterium]
MNNGVNFILESGFSLALFSVIYVLLLRRETFFKLNRFFLLASLFFSIILPFLKFKIYNPGPVILSEITVTPYRNLIEAVTVYGRDLSGTLEHVILSYHTIIYIYIGIVVIFLIRFIFRLSRVLELIANNPSKKSGIYRIITIEEKISPFSFLNYIFISKGLADTEEYPRLLLHEKEHVRQGHSFDILIIEILTAFHWFNPFIWMLQRAVRENHEYLADQAVIHSGVNFAYYKKMLLNQFVGGQLVIANNFNYSLIKSRLKMLSRIRSARFANTKLISGILIAAGLVIAFACEQKEMVEIIPVSEFQDMKLSLINGKLKIKGSFEELDKIKSLFADNKDFTVDLDSLGFLELSKKEDKLIDGPVYAIVEEMPRFPGGENAMRKYISNTIQYPEDAVSENIQGRVFVSFIIAKDGYVKNASVAEGVYPSLDKEALRVINSLPEWRPGKQEGKKVNVSYTVPINFQLQ